jgi:hypothetical protein
VFDPAGCNAAALGLTKGFLTSLHREEQEEKLGEGERNGSGWVDGRME